MSQTKIEEYLKEGIKWRKHLDHLDRGSYCEEASDEYKIAFKITTLYDELVDNMIKYQRREFKEPK